MCGRIKTIIGSVYIPPGDFKAMQLLDTVIGNITSSYTHVIIGMDANARSLLWDDKCVGVSRYCTSVKMGDMLECIMDKYGLLVHNDGTCTYHSGNYSSTPDVTLSLGLSQYGITKWSIILDELKSPHDGILFEVGNNVQCVRKEVKDWNKFDWTAYGSITSTVLNELSHQWMLTDYDDFDVDIMAKQLNDKINECVDKVAIKKIITKHSKPWINREISNKLKDLRNSKKKCRLRRSRANVNEYIKLQSEIDDVIKKSEEEWWISECDKLSEVSNSEKWKLINKLTNQSNMVVQPIRKTCNVVQNYLFNDDDICHELEQYPICKEQANLSVDLEIENEIQKAVSEMVHKARQDCDYANINADISDYKVTYSFDKGSDTILITL